LLSVTVLGNPAEDDEFVIQRCKAELSQWFPQHNVQHWQFLAIYRIPFAQFAQQPGIYDQLPDNRTAVEGLYLAGEYTKSSSIQGAMHSGEYAAKELLKTPLHVPTGQP
jgi:predicted NAD/FAD-dependent oxidoreductase